MATHGRAAILRSTPPPPPPPHRKILLFPLPFQGHITPMLQLANILHTQGFSITIIHTQYNSPNPSNYPHFTFEPISEGFAEIANLPVNPDVSFYIKYLNKNCVDSFRICLARLLAESDEEPVACVITDAVFYFAQDVADELKIPRLVLRTSSLAWNLVQGFLPFFAEDGCFNLKNEDCNAPVPKYPIMKVKDVLKMSIYPQSMGEFVTIMLKQMKASSGIIWNTFKELEESELQTICEDFPVPNYTIGPLHKYFSASSSSLIEQDQGILSWLDTQAPKSTIYISFGSVAHITASEFQEVAHGLENTGFPFLWVVRPGVVRGSEWLESLPEKFLESVGDKGRIVKWSPQQEVLAHPATGCFLTHSGWNSTTESICEGVPMVCSPSFGDQPINARYVSDVWKIGVVLEDALERTRIEGAIRRVMMSQEGKEMHKRVNCLKKKVNISLEEGGSSFRSLESLVNHILSF